jgi:hypothetical protein
MDNPDQTLWVEFYTEAVEHPNKSREAGRPIFEDREFVKIKFPADSKRVVVAPANEMHYHTDAKMQMTYAQRFPRHYEAFKAQIVDFVAGTPLTEAPFLTAAKRAELNTQNVRTVEQLAGLADSAIRTLGPGWRETVSKAQAFLKAAEGTVELDELRKQIAELKASIKAPKQAEPDPFEGMDRDDLFNIATDAGLEPRANATRASLVASLTEAAQRKTEAA